MSTKGQTLDHSFLDSAWESLSNDSQYKASRNAISKLDVLSVVENRDVIQEGDLHVYSNQVSKEGKCTSQKSSGRCWMFAMCNVMRVAMMKKYNLPDDFELSQGFLFYYDKLERANYFLEDMIATRSEPPSSRLVSHLVAGANLIGDGGQWDMLINIVNKYGIVPKKAYPETQSCVASRRMNQFLKNKLRQYGCELRKMYEANKSISEDDLRQKKFEYMNEYHKILSTFMGKPPTTFNWSFRDNKKNFHQFQNLTPLTFYQDHVPLKADDYVSLIHDPRNDYYKHYTVANLGNVQGGYPIRYINVPIDVLRALTITAIDDDEPVWFGCDVGKSMHREAGLLHHNIYDFDSAFGTSFGMDKRERLLYGESLMTHAMVITAYDRVQLNNIDDNEKRNAPILGSTTNEKKDDGSTTTNDDEIKEQKIKKWRVENSWGTDKGDKGYLSMSDEWFNQYVFQIAVHKKYLDKNLMNILKQKPITLPAWDPMGALAKSMM
jgi:bleomycin hydrolase